MASFVSYGKQTGPTAGTAVVSLVLAQKGRYRVSVGAGLEGTNIAGDNDNIQLLNSGGTVSVLLATFGGSARYTNPEIMVDVAAGGTLSVVAVGNAGTAAIYSAVLVATPDALF